VPPLDPIEISMQVDGTAGDTSDEDGSDISDDRLDDFEDDDLNRDEEDDDLDGGE